MADVSTPSAAHDNMAAKIHLPRTLMGGTRAMRAAGKRYLPKETAEEQADYDARLARSTLFNGFRKTVRDMAGKVFDREVTLGEDVPEQLALYAENIDRAGRHVNVFAKDLFTDGLVAGVNYILVDMPPAVRRPDGQPATLADEQAAGIRPYLCHLRVEDVIGWKSIMIGGVETLIQVRIKECVLEPDGEYAEKEVEQIRVLMPGVWQTWRRSTRDKDEWILHGQGLTSLPKITLVPIYYNGTGFMTGEPPLEDLADLNHAHWQSQSDQRNILHVARVPILFGAGFAEDTKIIIGASTMNRASDPTAQLKFVEHSGAAIGSGDKDLANLEFQMQAQGLQLIVKDPEQTATGEVRDDSKENSPLAMMAAGLEDGLERAFAYMAEYIGLGEEAGGSITVNKDYGVQIGAADLTLLLNAVNAGQISKETFWSELLRRKVLAQTFDSETEKDRLASEAPALDAGVGSGMNLKDDRLGAPGTSAT